MPNYEYRCPMCLHKFERIREPLDAPTERECPKCSGTARRIFSTYSIRGFFKFYGKYPGDRNVPDPELEPSQFVSAGIPNG